MKTKSQPVQFRVLQPSTFNFQPASKAQPAPFRVLQPSTFNPQPGSKGAFTLLEMIAVLAIIAILLAAVIPRWIKRIDLAAERAEVSTLTTISNALTSQALRGAPFLDHTTWTQAVADWSMLPTTKVAANARRYSRVYYTEAAASLGKDYSQGLYGTNYPPTNLRAVVVSVLSGDELDNSNHPTPGGGPLNATYFNELWDLADGEKPVSSPWDQWKGKGDDLIVQRINYAPLFHHLILLNRETNDLPRFTINGLGPQTITRAYEAHNPGWDSYYLDGTVIGLCDTAGNTMTRYVLKQDISFVWEYGKWRAEILGAPESDSVADDFSQKAKEFLAAARYNKAFKGANQQGVVTAMYDFMFTYVFWANECPLFNTHGVSHEQVSEYRLLDWLGRANGRLDEFSKNLVDK